MNNNIYHALKPEMSREMKLEKALSQFTHEEITNQLNIKQNSIRLIIHLFLLNIHLQKV